MATPVSDSAKGRRTILSTMGSDVTVRAHWLAQQHLVDVPQRWAHVQGVAATASDVARLLDTEHADEIISAAWLHDVGYASDLAKIGFHPVDGARFARDIGMPDLVVRLIAFHTGSEFEAEQRGLLAELYEFTPPPGEIVDVVTFADMTTSPTGAPIEARDRVAEILTRYEPNTPVYDAVSASAPELLAAVERVNNRLGQVNANGPQPR
ncbi:HD domain-containing protein [Microbacterium pumilum]|uniref:HD domain-containing protein n=2 Tax=Microbacterium pumilum TaxID=344165 RepID=A0ABP5E2T1_9MICO